MNKVILASASPRRKELLKQIGIDFEVCTSSCEEKITKTDPAMVVCELSAQKAKDVWQKLFQTSKKASQNHLLVIGADTVVSYDGHILGKPVDKADAVRMLTMLSGKTHEVYTGVTFCYEEDGMEKVYTFYERTAVTFYPMSPEEIESYAASAEPMDKAGAYGIQGRFAAYVKGIEGDYNNVVGLPTGRVYQEIKELLDR